MRKYAVVATLLICIVVGCGGGGGDGPTPVPQGVEQLLATCSQDAVVNLLRIFNQFQNLVAVIQGADVPFGSQFEIDRIGATNGYDYDIGFDTNGNGEQDTIVSGTATFSRDPALLDADDTATVTIDIGPGQLAGDAGTLSGSGTFMVTFLGPLQVNITGNLRLSDSASACNADLSFPAPGLNFFLEPIVPGPALTLNVLGLEADGLINAIIEAAGLAFDGTISLPFGSQTATVDGDANGGPVTTEVDVFPDAAVFLQMSECILGLVQNVQSIVTILSDVGGAVAAGDSIPGFTLTPVTANQFDYVLDIEPQFGVAGNLSGRITIGLTQAEVTWQITTPTLVGLPLTPGLTGSNAPGRPLTLLLSGLSLAGIHGAGSFTDAQGCTSTFDIPANDPLNADLSDGGIRLGVMVGMDILDARLRLDGFGEIAEAGGSINGIGIPPDLIVDLLFLLD